MKFQPKRFVVEVKRGTSRAAFASPDPSADRFGDAEAALFGSPGKSDPKPAPSRMQPAEVPSGRVLRSLVEPPPPVIEDPDPPVRRGRKPGSKNKPKPQLDVAVAADAEKPRRGRKPGSKNKPKFQVHVVSQPATAGRPDLANLMRDYGFADDGAARGERSAPTAGLAAPASQTAQALPPGRAGDAEQATLEAAPTRAGHVHARVEAEPAGDRPRGRLRERSSILRRYVLDIEPRPGQPGALRARRRARTP